MRMTVDVVCKTFVELLEPGSFYPESSTIQVTTRDPETVVREHMNDRVFAFLFFDVLRAEVRHEGMMIVLSSKSINRSGRYYPGGRLRSLEWVKEHVPDSRILQSNMDNPGHNPIMQTRLGNWQPFEEEDEIIDLKEVPA